MSRRNGNALVIQAGFVVVAAVAAVVVAVVVAAVVVAVVVAARCCCCCCDQHGLLELQHLLLGFCFWFLLLLLFLLLVCVSVSASVANTCFVGMAPTTATKIITTTKLTVQFVPPIKLFHQQALLAVVAIIYSCLAMVEKYQRELGNTNQQ